MGARAVSGGPARSSVGASAVVLQAAVRLGAGQKRSFAFSRRGLGTRRSHEKSLMPPYVELKKVVLLIGKTP